MNRGGAPTDAAWVKAFELERIPVGGAKVFKKAKHQVAVFRIDGETVFAVDNHCPHEGYPLAQGYVKDCVLTCAWHNFKFDLRDGRCVMGGEDVRTWPVRVIDGVVELDLSPPDTSIEVPKLMKSLEEGLEERALGRVARDVVRLLSAGVAPERIALAAARFDAERQEYGTTHALPVAEDVLRYLPRYRGVKATKPLMQALDMASEAGVRMPPRPVPAPVDPGLDPEAAGARLRALVEAEDAVGAEALLRGALEAGWGREVVEPWLFRLCSDHFLDFGHALIYQVKIFDLIDRVGWAHAIELLPAHLFRIVNGTREDTLPGMARFKRLLGEIEPELPELHRLQREGGGARWARTALIDAALQGTTDEVFEAVATSLRAGVPALELMNALSIAAAERILRFDVGIAFDPAVQEDWLDVTHLLTYANAARRALERDRHPEALKQVFLAARFIHNGRTLDMPAERRFSTQPAADVPALEGIGEAIVERQTQRAISLASAWLAQGMPAKTLWEALEDRAIDDPATRAIWVAHYIKTTIAARDEFEALEGDPQQVLPLLAVVRWMASPAKERTVGRFTVEAINFVAHGRLPKKLTD